MDAKLNAFMNQIFIHLLSHFLLKYPPNIYLKLCFFREKSSPILILIWTLNILTHNKALKNETVIYIIYSSQNFFLLKVINAIYVLTTNYLSADSKEMGRYFFTSVQQMFSNLNKQYDTYGVIPVGIVKKWMDFFHDILQKLQTIFTMFYKFVFKKAHVPIIVEKEKTLRSRSFNFY